MTAKQHSPAQAGLRGLLPSVATPGVLADLHVDALTKVSTFSGSLRWAQVLPARTSLKTLRVPNALLCEGTSLTDNGTELGPHSPSPHIPTVKDGKNYDDDAFIVVWGVQKPYRQVSPPPRHLQSTHSTHHPQDLCPPSPHTSPLPGAPTAT
jgi:hypothetical protein